MSGGGSIGFKDIGRERALEFPDGQNAEVSPVNRARVRYNDDTGDLEASVDGGPYTRIGGLAQNGLGWVDAIGGDDSTAAYGRLDAPFQTVQAAVDAAYATGGDNLTLVVFAGDYPEDVVIQPPATQFTRLTIFGLYRSGVTVRSFTMDNPTGGQSSEVVISSIGIGSDAGGQTVPAITLQAPNNGQLDLRLDNVDVSSSTPGVDVMQQINNFGVLLCEAVNCNFSATDAASGSRGLFLNSGSFVADNCTIRGTDASSIVVENAATFTMSGGFIDQGGFFGGFTTLQSNGTGGIVLVNVRASPASFFDNILGASNSIAQFTVFNLLVIDGFYFGNVFLNNNVLAYSIMTNVAGTPIPIVSALQVRLQRAEQVGASLGTLGNTTVDAALENLLLGVTNIVARVIGPTAIPPTTQRTFTCDTTAGAVTFNLPSIAAFPRGKTFRFVHAVPGAADIIVNATGGDTVGNAASFNLPAGANNYVEIQSELSTNNWAIVALRP